MAASPRGDTPICYVSSEHCYQKPGASWEKAEQEQNAEEAVRINLVKLFMKFVPLKNKSDPLYSLKFSFFT